MNINIAEKQAWKHQRKQQADVLRKMREILSQKKRLVNTDKQKDSAVVVVVCLLLALLILIVCGTKAHASESKIVKVAQTQIGKGEIGGDNRGSTVKFYTKGQEVAWCAAFVSWTLRQSGHDLPYLLSARSYYKNPNFKHVKQPKSGDIIVFYRGKRTDNTGHVGIVEEVRGNKITTIEGNVGKYPAVVKRITYDINNIKNLIGFVRVK